MDRRNLNRSKAGAMSDNPWDRVARGARSTSSTGLGLPLLRQKFFLKVLFYICLVVGWAGSFSGDLGFRQENLTYQLPIGAVLLYSACVLLALKINSETNAEKAGDSCYYLGFLLTLVALIASLFTLADGGIQLNRTGVLRQFGVALSTTVIGMFFRIVIVQFQETAEEASEHADNELTDRVKELSSIISTATHSFSSELERSVKVFGETGKEMREQLTADSEAHREAVTLMTEGLKTALERSVEEFAEKMKNTDLAPKELSDAIVSITQTLKTGADELVSQFSNVSDATTKNAAVWSDLTNQVGTTAKNLTDISSAFSEINTFPENLKHTEAGLKTFSSQLELLSKGITEAVESLEIDPAVIQEVRVKIDADLASIRSLRDDIEQERRNVAQTVREVEKELTTMAEYILKRLKNIDDVD